MIDLIHPALRLDDRGDQFTLSFKGKTLLEHSPKDPCVQIGRGHGRFRFYYGLFKIRDGRQERLPCRDYIIRSASDERVVIEFPLGEEGALVMTSEVIDGRAHFGFRSTGGNWNRFWIHWKAEAGEKVYGGGEQYTHLNLRGRKLPIWVQEPGLGRGFDLLTFVVELTKRYGGRWFTTYYSQPTFVFTSGTYLHSESSAYTEADFRRSDRHTLHTWDIPEKIVVGAEGDPPSLLDSLTSYLGRQPKLPSWAYDGMWLGAQGGIAATRAKLEAVRNAGVKVGGLWCQDWEGIRITSFGKQLMWDWSYDKDLYPYLPEYVKSLEAEGIRYLGYINPFLALEGELYKEAAEKGYCVKNARGEDYLVTITSFPAAMLDLTHPECREWIKRVIKENMIGVGLSGWMADYGEYIPTDAVFHDGSDGLTYHNRYVAEWARINREAVVEAGKSEDITFFMRAGYTGSTAHSSGFWNGDQLVNWSLNQGFATVIPGSVSLGFIGAAYLHSDIGGFTTVLWLKRSRELILRWAEQAAFTQTMRSHEGNRPYVGVRLHEDKVVLAHLAKMTGIFTALKPYHEVLSEDYQKSGLPPMRHPWLHYPDEEALHDAIHQYQYMYGPDLFVAPVVKKGRKRRSLYLPKDQWIHLWSGAEYDGGSLTVEAPIGMPPVFYRKETPWIELFRGLKEC